MANQHITGNLEVDGVTKVKHTKRYSECFYKYGATGWLRVGSFTTTDPNSILGGKIYTHMGYGENDTNQKIIDFNIVINNNQDLQGFMSEVHSIRTNQVLWYLQLRCVKTADWTWDLYLYTVQWSSNLIKLDYDSRIDFTFDSDNQNTTTPSSNYDLNITDYSHSYDYQLAKTFTVNNISHLYVDVDFTKYDYKFEIVVSKVGGTNAIGLFPASNNTVLTNWADRWAYHGLVTTTNNSSPNAFCYARATDNGGYIWLIDSNVDNKPDHYNHITAEVAWDVTTDATINYKSNASRTYNNNFEVRTAGGVIYSSTLCSQLCLTNGADSSSQKLYGYVRVYQRPRAFLE